MKAIDIRSAVKTFGDVKALNNMTFSISKGITIILGPNGAGKSTLLRCIDGLYKLNKGTVRVFGEDPLRNDALKNRVALLSDNYALYDYLTVQDNLKFFGRLYSMKDKDIMKSAKSVLRLLEAEHYLDKKVYMLSRGTKQKIAFCRAVLNDPQMLLLDEPSAFLDANSSEEVRHFIEDYKRKGRTILYVTQKLEEVTRFDARIMIIKEGRIIRDTDTNDLDMLKNSAIEIRFAKPVSKAVIDSIRGFGGLELTGLTLKVKVKNYKDVNRILKQLMERGAYIMGIDYLEPFVQKVT